MAAFGARVRALRAAGLLSAAEQAVQGWQAEVTRKGDLDGQLRCVNAMVRLALDRDEPEAALRIGEQGLPLALGARRGAGEARCLLYVGLGWAACRLGFFLKALHFLDAAQVTAGEEPVAPDVRARCLMLRGNLAAEEARFAEAASCMAEARVMAREVGDRRLADRAALRLARSHNRSGDLDRGLAELDSIGPTAAGDLLARVQTEYGTHALLSGKVDAAESWARVAAAGYCRAPVGLSGIDLADLFALTGHVHLRRGSGRIAALMLSEAGKWYAMRHRERQFVAVQEELQRCAVDRRDGLAPDGTLMYLGDLLDNVMLHPEGSAHPAVHSRRLARLIEEVGADLAPRASLTATEHAALLHELPCEQRWFCRLSEDGQAAERVLSAPQSDEGVLLRLLDQYETLVAGGLRWPSALRRLRECGAPAQGLQALQDLHEAAAGSAAG